MTEEGFIPDWSSATPGTWVYANAPTGTLVYTQDGGGTGYTITATF
jgi:hypothetical protein